MSLKDLWEVDAPNAAPGSSSPQGEKFRSSFKSALLKINSSLQYTVAHAEKAGHDTLSGRREALYGRFQETLKKIDPADESKAERSIKDVLSEIDKLDTDAAALKRETEAAEQAWAAQEAGFEAASGQITELADWGDTAADQLQADATSTQALVDGRKYRDAVTACELLQATLEPAYAAYSQQKAAMAQYDTELAALEPRLTDLAQPGFASLIERQQAIEGVRAQMTDSADAKDYLQAVQTLGELATQVDEVLAARGELEGKQQAYVAARAALEPRFPTASEGGGTAVLAQQEAIAAAIADLTAAAQADDFDNATRLLGELEPRLAEFETLIEQRDAYSERLTTLQPRLPTATEPGAGKLAEVQDAIATLQTDSEASATAGDFTTATRQLDELELELDEFDAITEARARYDEAFARIQPRIPTTGEPGNGRLDTVQQEIATLSSEMQAAAEQSDYETALTALEELDPKITEFETLSDLRLRYDEGWAALQPELPTSSQHRPQRDRRHRCRNGAQGGLGDQHPRRRADRRGDQARPAGEGQRRPVPGRAGAPGRRPDRVTRLRSVPAGAGHHRQRRQEVVRAAAVGQLDRDQGLRPRDDVQQGRLPYRRRRQRRGLLGLVDRLERQDSGASGTGLRLAGAPRCGTGEGGTRGRRVQPPQLLGPGPRPAS